MDSTIERIGWIGGGQLALMEIEEANHLGFKQPLVIDPSANCPATRAGAEIIVAKYMDTSAVFELGQRTDVMTLDLEHVPAAYMEAMGGQLRWNMQPAPHTVAIIQNKLRQHRYLEENGIPVVPFSEELDEAAFHCGGPYIVKLQETGYDGRGNMKVDTMADFFAALENDQDVADNFGGKPVYVEQAVDFEKELSVVAARDMNGAVSLYPVVETQHERGICNIVISPAGIDPSVNDEAREVAYKTMSKLDGAGVFAIEMFLVNGKIYVNEIAPRVHNSGHLTLVANETNQFQQHIRAITGMQLGSTALKVSQAVMINVLGRTDIPGERTLYTRGMDRLLSVSNTYPYLYGKNPKPDRKVGHVTVTSDIGSPETIDQLVARAHRARAMLSMI